MGQSIETVFERHGLFVSRETIDKLYLYEHLLLKWQKAINLVGPTTLAAVAERHFLDSAQMFGFIENVDIRMADMGSGAGFPGMVLAMLGVKDVHLIESDIRKATFLREVSRETSTPVTIHDKRAEDCVIENIDLFTARALAPLKDLLAHAGRLGTAGHEFSCLFLKGAQYAEEIDKAGKQWSFEVEVFPSVTGDAGKLIKISKLSKK